MNNIGDKGAESLSFSLLNNLTNLRTLQLNLSYNNISEKGTKPFC